MAIGPSFCETFRKLLKKAIEGSACILARCRSYQEAKPGTVDMAF